MADKSSRFGSPGRSVSVLVLDLAGAQAGPGPKSRRLPRIDPQQGWLKLHRNICEFLDSMPQAEYLRVRGEDLLSEPDAHLKRIADWLRMANGPGSH